MQKTWIGIRGTFWSIWYYIRGRQGWSETKAAILWAWDGAE